MAEQSPFPFTACIDHAHYQCREVVTLSASCNFKSEKSTEERPAKSFSLREPCPNEIRVIIQKADRSQIPYGKNKLYIRADSNLADLFVAIWNQIFKIKVGTKKYALFMLLKYKNPVFKKLMSSVYEEYKDEDGTLNISLSGEIRDILPQPSPNNISASTFFVNNIPSNFKLYHERKNGMDLSGLFYEYLFKKGMKDDEGFRKLECSQCPCPSKLIFYLAATGLEYKKEDITLFRKLIKQYNESFGQIEERMDMELRWGSHSTASEIDDGELRNNYISEFYYIVGLILFIFSVKLMFT